MGSWNDEEVELLKKLWGSGLTAKQITEEFAGKYTRNAIIGKANRLKLTKNQKQEISSDAESEISAKATDLKQKTTATAKGKKVTPKGQSELDEKEVAPLKEDSSKLRQVADDMAAAILKNSAEEKQEAERSKILVEPVPLNLGLLDLTENTCKWPVSSPQAESYAFCGVPTVNSSAYCAYHAEKAFQVPRSRQKRAG